MPLSSLVGRRTTFALALIGIAEMLGLAAPTLKKMVLHPEELPVARGARLVRELGCVACHRSGDSSGNAGGAPSFAAIAEAGADDPTVLVDAIQHGVRPAAPPDGGAASPQTRTRLEMPAYGKWIAEDDVRALVAYIDAQSPARSTVAPELSALARAHHCFGCHGPGGAGGVSNPGAFKGYVPALTGRDYEELVQSDDELREWIRTGTSSRLRANPLARAFLERQAIHMPAFGQKLSADEVEALVKMVHGLRTQPLAQAEPH